MSYGLKYRIPFTNIEGVSLSVRFKQLDYVGSSTDIDGGEAPFVLAYQSGEDNPLEPIRGSEATVQYKNDGTLPVRTFLSDDDEEWQIELYNEDDTRTEWIGFLVQDDCRAPFMPAPSIVTLRATDNLGLLQTIEFTDTTDAKVYGKILLTQYLEYILDKTGLSLPVNIYSNVFEDGMDDRTVAAANDAFDQAKIHTRTFTKDATTFEDCYSVLKKIMEAWECSIFQDKGEWQVVRWPELKDFDNLIPGTSYSADFSTATAAILPVVKNIGKTQSIKLVNAVGEESIVRGIKYDKLTFNYEQPYKLILNDDFKELGSLISTSTVGTTRTDKYNIPHWTYNNPPATNAYIEKLTNTITGIEIDRYAVLPFNNTSTTYLKATQLEVNANDRFDCSLRFRASSDTSDNIIFRFGFLLVGSGGVNYTLTNVSGSLVWNNIGAGTTANALTQTVSASADATEWTDMNIFYGTTDLYIPVIPVDGNLELQVKGFSDTNVSQPNRDAYIKDINFDYYTYINDSIQISGHYHKSEKPTGPKKNIDKVIYIDDAPKNNIRGTMFLDDGTTKTSLWHRGVTVGSITVDFIAQIVGNNLLIQNQQHLFPHFKAGMTITISGTTSNNGTFTISSIIKNLTTFQVFVSPALNTETATGATIVLGGEEKPFGYIQKIDLIDLYYTPRIRIDGDFKGMKQSTEYVGLTSVFELDDLPDRYFITGPVRYNWKSCIWSGSLHEIWNNSTLLVESSADLTNTFEYIYNQD